MRTDSHILGRAQGTTTHATFALLAMWSLLFCVSAVGQSAESTAVAHREQWRAHHADLLRNDFGELSRYRDANVKIPTPSPGENRVIFFGDSITDFWKLEQFFPGKPYINRGITGQTTSQMLVRFRQDVINLHPRTVVILAGTNDIAGNTGPISISDIEANYASMAELARASDIHVVFSSVLPVHNYTPEAQDFYVLRPTTKILELNRWIKTYCQAGNCSYLDYFSVLVDDHGLLRKDLADDGLHPNEAGYKIMAPLAEAAIRKASAVQK